MRHLMGMFLCLLAAGCATTETQRERALHRVAKDWSQVIRASQVIPVYPLTEDLLPGDVFLVQTTADQQHTVYRQRGFLPIDPPVTRLPIGGYDRYYRDFSRLDPCRGKAASAPPTAALDVSGLLYNPPCLAKLPQAAFPTYSFDVGSSRALGLALPLQAVSVGLNLTSSSQARGSVSIQDAYTFGVDIESLMEDLDHWAKRNKALLAPYRGERMESRWYRPVKGEQYRPRAYLRVVNRVYVARALDVHMESQQARGAKGEAGLSVPGVGELAGDAVDRTLDQIRSLDALNCKLAGGSPLRAIDSLPRAARVGLPRLPVAGAADEVACRLPPSLVNKLLQDPALKGVGRLPQTLARAVDQGVPMNLLAGLPSLRLQVSSVSKGSVGMRENFERPLVIGYVGFDVPIDDRGALGPPVPSYAVLERGVDRGAIEHVEIDLGKSDWETKLDELADAAQPARAASETMRCLGRELRDPGLVQRWQRDTAGNTKGLSLANELRKRVAMDERVSLSLSSQFLARALSGARACTEAQV